MATGIRIPPQVPPPLRDGYGDTYEETRTSVEMDAGAPRIRNKMRSAPRLFTLTWHMSAAVYKVFDIWFAETIAGGAKEFDIQLLDDSETLVWYTATFEKGSYRAAIEEDNNWRVSATLRAVGDSFPTRPPGTDELRGVADLSLLPLLGVLVIKKSLSGRVDLGIGEGTRGVLKPFPMFGIANLNISARGALYPRPLYGIAQMSLTATGTLQQFGDPELILQFSGTAYTPDNGATVELQFDSTVYYPPKVV